MVDSVIIVGFNDLSGILKCKLLNCKKILSRSHTFVVAKVQNFNDEKKKDLLAQLSFIVYDNNALISGSFIG